MELVTVKRKRTPKWIPCIVIMFGLAFISMGAVFLYRSHVDKKKCTESVTATVIELKEHRSKDTEDGTVSVTYAPVFEYVYEDFVYSVVSSMSSNPPQFSVDQSVIIYVDPDDPMRIYVPGDSSALVLFIVFLGIGISPVLVGAIWLILLVRASRRDGTDEIEFQAYIVSKKEANEVFKDE